MVDKLIRVALVYGGRSGEHEISLRSAASVFVALDRNRYTVIPIGIDKTGCFYLNDAEALRAHPTYPDSLPVNTPESVRLPGFMINGHLVVDVDVVFPVVHGPLYEDGAFQGLLALANVAYVGCEVLASALGMDKDMARRIACVDDVQCTPYRVLDAACSVQRTQRVCDEAAAALGWPLFVKPCCMGSSVGIRKVHTPAELLAAVAEAKRYDTTVLIEAFIDGREIELSVLESLEPDLAPQVSVPGEISVTHPDGFYSYNAKYVDSAASQLHIPAALDAALVQRLQMQAAAVFTRLRCRGMARVDFFVTPQAEIYFNEINTLPGFTSISMYPKLMEASGISYPTLLNQLITLAQQHHQRRLQLETSYQ